MTLEEKIHAFKSDLIAIDTSEVFDKYLMSSDSYLFSELQKNSNIELKIKSLIAHALQTNIDNVFLMGSAKLGFSISPRKLYNPLDFKFKSSRKIADKSDLDFAVVCPNLFSRIGREMYNFTNSFKNKWNTNEYYTENKFDVMLAYKYFEYFTKGWFRIDYRPVGYDFCTNEWTTQKLKQDVYILTRRKLTIAIYSESFYFQNYHIDNLRDIARRELTRKIPRHGNKTKS